MRIKYLMNHNITMVSYSLKKIKKQENNVFTHIFTIFGAFYLYRLDFPCGYIFFQSEVLPLSMLKIPLAYICLEKYSTIIGEGYFHWIWNFS